MFQCVPDLQVLADCAVMLRLLKESGAIFVLFLQKLSSMAVRIFSFFTETSFSGGHTFDLCFHGNRTELSY